MFVSWIIKGRRYFCVSPSGTDDYEVTVNLYHFAVKTIDIVMILRKSSLVKFGENNLTYKNK